MKYKNQKQTIIVLLSFVFLNFFISPLFAQEEKKTQKLDKPVSKKIIAKEMSVAWCQKLEQCQPRSSMSVKECRKILKKSFLNGFKHTQGKKIQVTQVNLNACTKNINEGSCEALQKAQALEGCEFIQYLNRY